MTDKKEYELKINGGLLGVLSPVVRVVVDDTPIPEKCEEAMKCDEEKHELDIAQFEADEEL